MLVAHAFNTGAHAVLVGVGTGCVVIGVVQIARTLQLGGAVTNANAVITRCSIMIGIGSAFLYGAFIHF